MSEPTMNPYREVLERERSVAYARSVSGLPKKRRQEAAYIETRLAAALEQARQREQQLVLGPWDEA